MGGGDLTINVWPQMTLSRRKRSASKSVRECSRLQLWRRGHFSQRRLRRRPIFFYRKSGVAGSFLLVRRSNILFSMESESCRAVSNPTRAKRYTNFITSIPGTLFNPRVSFPQDLRRGYGGGGGGSSAATGRLWFSRIAHSDTLTFSISMISAKIYTSSASGSV